MLIPIPIALRVALSDGSGFDLTEAGTKKSLAVYVVNDRQEVPVITPSAERLTVAGCRHGFRLSTRNCRPSATTATTRPRSIALDRL